MLVGVRVCQCESSEREKKHVPCSLLNSRISDKKTVYVFERERETVCAWVIVRESICVKERGREKEHGCV